MKKKMISLILVVALAMLMVLPVSAGTSTNYYGKVKVTATCNKQSSSHRIEEATSGSALLYYTYNGTTSTKKPSMTYPGTKLWTASISISSGTAYKATTTYSGNVVTAVY